MPDVIATHEHTNPAPFIQHMVNMAQSPMPAPEKVDGEVQARVDYGRWVAECPDDCKWAVVVSAQTPLFFCAKCRNAKVGGKWRKVVFPHDREKIEYHLLKRIGNKHRFWNPGEKVADLIRENAAHGVV